MDGKRLLHSLQLNNFLSYGPQGIDLMLEPLNILIGQNASGKSNLIQAIELLRATPTNLSIPIIQGGGVEEWIYKGGNEPSGSFEAFVSAHVDYPERKGALEHWLSFTSSNGRLYVADERINIASSGYQPNLPKIYYDHRNDLSVAASQKLIRHEDAYTVTEDWESRILTGIKSDQSVLSQRNDPDSYPALNYLSEQYRDIKIYRGFNFDGPNSMRRAQQPDLPTDFLEEDGRNLGLILNDLQYRGALDTIVEKLKAVYEDVESISVRVAGGTVQTFLRERGMSSPIPAARLSDGTLRYLCLLAILYHPAPPPLICLEEPEVGLHPDLISGLAKMLKEASQRTQLIVTTHSDLLVSKFSDTPEAVVVCERTPGGTTLQRLDAKKLEYWLEEYSLGEVWLKGGIGGTRW